MNEFGKATLTFDDKNIEVALLAPSFKRKRLFLDIYKKTSSQEKQARIQAFVFSKIGDAKNLSDSETQNIIAEGLRTRELDIEELIETRTAETIINDDILTVEAFKAIVDAKSLDSDKQKLVFSNWDSEFWQEQDLENIEAAVNSFRVRFRITDY